MFITAAMDNKINMILDNDFGENELIRTLEMKEVLITSLDFDPVTKMVIVATNTGITAFYESDTGKQNGSYSEATVYEEITSLNLIKNLPYIITTTTNGKINFIALQPLLFKFQKVFSFRNEDSEQQHIEKQRRAQEEELIRMQEKILDKAAKDKGYLAKPALPTATTTTVNKALTTDSHNTAVLPPAANLSISNCVYCNATKRLFLSDDKGFIKCFDISEVIEILEKSLAQHKDKSNNGGKSFLTPPSFDGVEYHEIWSQRAHYEVIKSLEYIH